MFSILYYLFTLLQVTVLFIVSIIVLIVTYPFDKSRRWVHECSRLICFLLYDLFPLAKRTIEGAEHIDRKKPYVMVFNHNSGFDIFTAYKIPLNFRWVSKREVFWVPFMGPLLSIHGDIPIERGNPKKAMEKVSRLGKLWLKRGATVAIFPEGTRSKDGEIHNFKLAAFSLAKEAGVTLTTVGATYPYGNDLHDRNIRIAPTYPSNEDLARAMEVLSICVKLSAVEKFLGEL